MYSFIRSTQFDLYAPGIKAFLKEKSPNEVVKIVARLLHKENPRWKYTKLARKYVNRVLRDTQV